MMHSKLSHAGGGLYVMLSPEPVEGSKHDVSISFKPVGIDN